MTKLGRTVAAVAVSAGIGLPIAVERWLEPNLAGDLSRALSQALHLPASAVSVADARLRAPARLTVRDVRIGRTRLAKLELRADPWDALKAVAQGHRPTVIGVTIEGLDVPGIAHAASAEITRELLHHRARLIVKKAELAAVGRLPWAISSDEAAVDFEDNRPSRVAFTGAALSRSDPGARLDGLSGSASRHDDGWHVRAARPGLTVAGTLGWPESVEPAGTTRPACPTRLTARLEELPLAGILGLLHAPAVTSPNGTIDGTVSLERDAAGDATAQLDVELTQVTLHHRIVAQAPIPLGRVHVDAKARLARGILSLDHATVDSGDLHVQMSGSGSAGGAVVAELRLGKVGCGALLRSLPTAALPSLEGLGVDGDFAGKASLRGDLAHLPDVQLDVDLDVGCHVLSDPPLAEVAALNGPVVGRATTADGTARPLALSSSNPSFRSFETLPASVVRPFLAAEDVRFWQHHGFDVEMIRRALAIDLDEGRVDRGASTISQQLVKNLFLSQERTLCRKVEEAVLTWRLEQKVKKTRILELYLNLVELGPGIYGLGEGAERYFGKEPEELSSDEAAQLAALLPAPKRGMDDAWRRRYDALRARISRASHPTEPVRAGRLPRRR